MGGSLQYEKLQSFGYNIKGLSVTGSTKNRGYIIAHLEVDYYSQVLCMDRTMNVILPELSDHNPTWKTETLQDITVLYLLHGMYGDHSTWQRRTSIERLIRQTPLAVIMPSTDLAWYTNTTYGLRYFDAIAKELPAKAAQFFPQLSKKGQKTLLQVYQWVVMGPLR